MAEFKTVMRERHRMCLTHDTCSGCEIEELCKKKSLDDEKLMEEEAIIMRWAKEHEPQYPTWKEWNRKTFPGKDISLCNLYNRSERYRLLGYEHCKRDCEECREKPIPEEIAKKLGIEPIKG